MSSPPKKSGFFWTLVKTNDDYEFWVLVYVVNGVISRVTVGPDMLPSDIVCKEFIPIPDPNPDGKMAVFVDGNFNFSLDPDMEKRAEKAYKSGKFRYVNDIIDELKWEKS